MKKMFKLDYDLNERVFGLDLLRTIAILIVLLGHGDAIVRNNFPGFVDFWVVDGVDLFFVLSGFLIGSIIIKSLEKDGINRNSIVQFWKRRWFRTIPNYYLVIIFYLIYIFIKTHDFSDFSSDYLLFVQNFKKSHPIFLPVAWSLAIEEWFYILFPISILIIHKITPKLKVKKIIPIVIGFFLLLPLLFRIRKGMFYSNIEHADYVWDTLFRKTVITRLDTIAFGVLGAYLNFYWPKTWNNYKYIKFLLGISLIYIAQYQIKKEILLFTIYFDVLSLGILLLLPLLNSIKRSYNYISIPITYMSFASYSIYLIHFTFILGPILEYGKPFTNLSAIFFYIIYLTLSILISLIIFKYFENPMMKLREKKYEF